MSQTAKPTLAMIKDYLDKELRVEITDGRSFQGFLRCVDRDLNLILADSLEFSMGEKRVVGHIMIPGEQISKILQVDSSDPERYF